MTETALAVVMLLVSLASLAVQGAAWRRLAASAPTPPVRVRRGLLRTVGCRTAAAGLYVAVAVTMLVARHAFPALALAAFTATQLVWQANSVLDLRLRRDLAADNERR